MERRLTLESQMPTRAGIVALRPGERRSAIAARLDALAARGYNALVLPLLRSGDLFLRRGATGGLAGTLMDALACSRSHPCSVWLSIDPLSASRPTGELSALAREHRDWLLRNTSGHLTPQGSRGNMPLFSWMNMTWRRHLGDLLADLSAEHPFAGVLVDMRAWPGQSDTARRWYCCAFESQLRAEDALSTNFEYLLAEGTQSEIEAWQSWVRAEMRAFLEHLMGRARVHRTDLTWRLLVPAHDPRDPREAPWSSWVSSELFDEVVLQSGTGWPWSRLLAMIEEASSTRPVAMAAVAEDAEIAPMLADLADTPVAGFLHMAPARPRGEAGEPLPAHAAWARGHAAQDNPRAAAVALARHAADRIDGRCAAGRYLRRALPGLLGIDPTPENCERLRDRARKLEDALVEGRVALPDDAWDVRRELRLALRLAATMQPQAPVY